MEWYGMIFGECFNENSEYDQSIIPQTMSTR